MGVHNQYKLPVIRTFIPVRVTPLRFGLVVLIIVVIRRVL